MVNFLGETSVSLYLCVSCKTKASRIDVELAKSAATRSKNPRQCNNIQANYSNEEYSESSQIYSVATVNKILVQHKYVEMHLYSMPIEMLVDCGSNATIMC